MRVVPYWVAGLQQAAHAASLAQTWSLGVQEPDLQTQNNGQWFATSTRMPTNTLS